MPQCRQNLLGLRCALAVGVGALSACVSLDKLAPTVATLTSSNAISQLSHGRDIYITKCARCHVVEPVRKYDAAHWREIMPEMTAKSKLSAAETTAVEAYVFTVLKSPVATP